MKLLDPLVLRKWIACYDYIRLDLGKEGSSISTLKLKYTEQMEKAMLQFHEMGYGEYTRSLENRMKVERQREQNYYESKQLIALLHKQQLRP